MIAVILLAGTRRDHLADPLLVVYELIVGALIGGGHRVRRGLAAAPGGAARGRLYPLATIALIGGAYAVGVFAHASGFLAVYVAAVILGNSRLPHRASTLSFAEGLGWLAQIGLFVMLGLYVEPTGCRRRWSRACSIGLIVLLVARPISVVAAALPFRLPWREQAFLSWSGLRGAVPIVLAMIPLMNGVEHSRTAARRHRRGGRHLHPAAGHHPALVARKLGVIQSGQAMEVQVEAAPLDEMNAHVLQVTIPEKSKMHGVYVSQLRLPAPSTIALLLRDGEPVHRESQRPAAVRRSAADRRARSGSGRPPNAGCGRSAGAVRWPAGSASGANPAD